MNLPEKLRNFTPYPPMDGTVSARLDGNESPFPPPDALLEGIFASLRGIPLNRYPDPYAAGVCALAEAFWGAPSGSAVAGNGSDELISVALNGLLPRGGRLVVCDPDFSMYRFYAALYELECTGLDRASGVPGTEEIIEKGRGASAVILSNPCNPTGRGLPLDTVLYIAENLTCPVLLDEAYMDFWDEGRPSALPYINRYTNLVVLKTCSKNLALAGIRLGFAFAGAEMAAVLRAVKSPYNVGAVTQAIGAAVLRHPDILREYTRRITAQKELLYARLCEWAAGRDGCTVADTVTNFVNVSLPDAEGWHKRLRDKGVAVRLINGGLRVSAGTDAEIEMLAAALTNDR